MVTVADCSPNRCFEGQVELWSEDLFCSLCWIALFRMIPPTLLLSWSRRMMRLRIVVFDPSGTQLRKLGCWST